MSARRVLPMLVGVTLALIGVGVSPETPTAQTSTNLPRIRMLTPRKEQAFRPGDRVMITWEFVWPRGTREDPSMWCEQEIFLSLDGGKTNARRVTVRLAPQARSFEWTVPNTPTDNAVLDLHYGCDTTSSPVEKRNVQRQARFRILKPTKHTDEIQIAKLPARVAPSEAIQVHWESTVRGAGVFQVFVSYDRGGEYVQIGETYGTSFEWAAPAEYRGSLVFRIVTETDGGTVVESVHELPNVVTVR
jgi:hypothetical protein